MPFKKKYSDEELTKAVLLILDEDMSLKKASKITGITVRTLQRYKNSTLKEKSY
jgi:hypothetical protein